MERLKTLPVKGTEDISPKKMELIESMLGIIKKVYAQNGFNQIQTPILENLELLSRGDSGDNSKIMFKTVKRGAKLDLTKQNITEDDIVEEGLRYDLTVPLSRYFANNLNDLPKPFKSFQIGESFRAEKPQKGRNREFTQCDIDIFGESSIIAEIEILTTVMQVYKALGLENITIKVNDRRILNNLISYAGFDDKDLSSILIEVDKFDKIGIDGVREELNKLNLDLTKINTLLQSIAQIESKGIKECVNYGVPSEIISNIQTLLDVTNSFASNNVKVVFDVHIIRGQGYYTGTVFEAFCNDSTLTRAIGGGGRYDNMIDRYLNINVPAVGYGLGLVPCLLLLEEKNINLNKNINKIALVYKNDVNLKELMDCKCKLMKEYYVALMPEPKNYQAFITKMQNLGYNGLYKYSEQKFIWF